MMPLQRGGSNLLSLWQCMRICCMHHYFIPASKPLLNDDIFFVAQLWLLGAAFPPVWPWQAAI